jgi:hypothetical protein
MPDAFLDSSALIELVFRHSDTRKSVHKAIPSGGRRITSRYVVFEIARGYLLSLLILHNKSLSVKSLGELHEYMHSGQQRFKPYRSNTMLGAYDDFLAYLQSLGTALTEEQRLAQFRGWLSQHLRRGWRKLFEIGVVINSVGCREDVPSPSRNPNGYYVQQLPTNECGNADACGLAVYLSSSRQDFVTITKGLKKIQKPDGETKRRIDALERLIARRDIADFVGKDCWSCGDAIICHESPPSAVVVSKNRKHFEPLCASIGRTFLGYG